MDKLTQLASEANFNVKAGELEKTFEVMDSTYKNLKNFETKPGVYCGIDEIKDIFRWKKGFSYLFTGSPNSGKSTMVLYLYLLMALKYGYKFGIWTPEMEDSELRNGVVHHVKDVIFTLIWTLQGKTPYEYYAKKHQTALLKPDEIESSMNWIDDHFKFVHLYDRTPSALIESFTHLHKEFKIDGWLIDPWKSVKQVMNIRADLWMEDTLMSFKEFSMETDSILSFVVHPKALRDYKDEDGNYRVITPFDLNGGAAWFNSMDVIISLRKLQESTEWYTWKVRKQHLAGKTGQYFDLRFDMDTYRFYFGNNDPFNFN